MKVVVKILTYPLHLEEHPTFITFPVWRMHHLTQIKLQYAASVPGSYTADLYADV